MKNVPNLRFPNFKDEWSHKQFSTIFEELKTRTNDTVNYPLYSLTIEEGVVPKTERYEREFLVKKDDENFKVVEKDNFVYNPMNLRFGALACYKGEKAVSVSGYYNIFRVIDGSPVSFWDNYLKTNRMMYLYNTIATGSLIEKRRVHFSQFIDLKLPIPSIEEQEKIASFLSLIDKKIELQTEKVEELKNYKKGIMQKIFSQELRFKDENGNEYPEWEEVNLRKILKEVSEKTTVINQYEVISSTNNGLYLQKDYFNREIASKDNIGYKILKRNQVVLSPQNLWMGNINLNSKYDIGMVSPSYKIFDIKSEFDSSYIGFILRTDRAFYEYKQASEQGASIVRRNLNMDLFYDISFKLPCKVEQYKISKFINKIDCKIEQEMEKLDSLNQYKKGLLQQMFI